MAAADVLDIVEGYKPPSSNKKKWSPKRWEPMYDEMVLMSCLGKSNVDIARRFGYTKEHISVILNTKQAQVTKRLILSKLQETVAQTLDQRLAAIKDAALTRITQVLKNDQLMETAPMAVFDRSVTVLKGVGVLREASAGGSGGINAKNAVFINSEDAKGIREGLAIANEAARLNAPKSSLGIDVTEPANAAD
jgi:hypothetical protein